MFNLHVLYIVSYPLNLKVNSILISFWTQAPCLITPGLINKCPGYLLLFLIFYIYGANYTVTAVVFSLLGAGALNHWAAPNEPLLWKSQPIWISIGIHPVPRNFIQSPSLNEGCDHVWSKVPRSPNDMSSAAVQCWKPLYINSPNCFSGSFALVLHWNLLFFFLVVNISI